MPEKEIWKLLEEYLQTKNKDIQDFMNIAALMAQSDSKLYQTYIISKNFWFVKWLVDNDKINLLKLDNRIALSEFNKVERVLMALSISDTPIEDLISYLK